MELFLNSLLNLTQQEIENCKIELNMTSGQHGKPIIDIWLSKDENSKTNGLAGCSYWGWFQGKRNFFVGQWVLSFVKKSYDEWLFVSAGIIKGIPENSNAIVEIVDKYQPYFGRLVISYKKGNTYLRYVFKASKTINEMRVKEVLPCLYSGRQFEGYDRVNVTFMELNEIFAGKIMPTYYEALKKITGVYCLTDKSNGKLYIGSATGTDGVAQRWGNYLETKTGGNVKLIKLYNEKGEDYFTHNFTFTLLEYFGLSYDTEKIKDREQYWKKCFDTIKNGYNDN